MGRGRSPRASGGNDRYDARDGLGYDDQPYDNAGNNDGPGYESREGAAVVPINEGANLPALADDSTSLAATFANITIKADLMTQNAPINAGNGIVTLDPVGAHEAQPRRLSPHWRRWKG